MTRFTTLAAVCLLTMPAGAQMLQLTREQMIQYTAKNPYERFPDGRPKVPAALLERARELSAEDCWGTLRRHRFENQFEGGFQILKPGRKLAGRALTALYMPFRPDMDEIISAGIKATGFPSRGHQFVIDQLQEGDVLVVDAWGTVPGFVGDNLATYIEVATKYGGLVIDGGIRDLEGMTEVNSQIYYRFAHPAAVANFTLVGVNVPVRIGKAAVMPGDVVIGDKEGVTFLPPQLLEETLREKTEIVIHDIWTKEKLRTGKYKSHEIYGRPRSPELIKEYEEYRARKYKELGLEPPKH